MQPMGQRRNHRENRIHLEMNENEKTTYQNVRNEGTAVLWREFIAVNAYIKKDDIMNCFFEKINKIDKPLPTLTKKKKEDSNN